MSMQAHARVLEGVWALRRSRGLRLKRGGRGIEWERGEKDGENHGRRLALVGGTIWWLMVVRYTDSLQMSKQPLIVFY